MWSTWWRRGNVCKKWHHGYGDSVSRKYRIIMRRQSLIIKTQTYIIPVHRNSLSPTWERHSRLHFKSSDRHQQNTSQQHRTIPENVGWTSGEEWRPPLFSGDEPSSYETDDVHPPMEYHVFPWLPFIVHPEKIESVCNSVPSFLPKINFYIFLKKCCKFSQVFFFFAQRSTCSFSLSLSFVVSVRSFCFQSLSPSTSTSSCSSSSLLLFTSLCVSLFFQCLCMCHLCAMSIKLFFSANNTVCIVGDLNAKHSHWWSGQATDETGGARLDFASSNGLIQLVQGATRNPLRAAAAQLDLMFLNDISSVEACVVLPQLSDHCSTSSKLNPSYTTAFPGSNLFFAFPTHQSLNF